MKKSGVPNRAASSPLRVNMPRVALLVETSREVGRSILRGVERYARINGPWSLHLAPGDLAQLFPNVSTWGATGIIARIETPEVERAILKSGLPFVALDLYEPQKSKRGKFKNASEVFVNSPLVGKMAAEHLLERNLNQYAFVGEINDVLWSTDREKAFTDTIVQAGYKVYRYKPPKTSDRTGDVFWNADVEVLTGGDHLTPSDVVCRHDPDRLGEAVKPLTQLKGVVAGSV